MEINKENKEATERGLVVYKSRDGQEIRLSFDTVRRYLVSGKPEFVTDQEIVLYMGMAKARGLNPFKKDCYLIKYTQDDPASTIISIDYFRSRAKAQEDCRGWQCGVIVQVGDKLVEREGAIVLEGEKLVGGWFRARPENWDADMYWTVPLNRYIKKTRDGRPTRFWQEDSQPEQIAKVAESQGLRRTWPDEFQGLYIREEIVESNVPMNVVGESNGKTSLQQLTDRLNKDKELAETKDIVQERQPLKEEQTVQEQKVTWTGSGSIARQPIPPNPQQTAPTTELPINALERRINEAKTTEEFDILTIDVNNYTKGRKMGAPERAEYNSLVAKLNDKRRDLEV